MKTTRRIAGDKKGFSLIIAMTLAMIAVVLIVPVMRRITTERLIVSRLSGANEAFYAAESAINLALRDLERNTSDDEWNSTGWNRTDPDRYTLGGVFPVSLFQSERGSCRAAIRDPLSASPIIEATGISGASERSIVISYTEDPVVPGSDFDKAIKTKGTINVQGAAQVNGDIEEDADFQFEDIFDGRTMEEVKNASYTQLVEDPSNNYEPVQRPAEGFTDSNMNERYDFGEVYVDSDSSGDWTDQSEVTWFDMTGGGTAMITRNDWSGNGILVIEGSARITGGTFDGVIYVIGNLDFAAGNPTINGAIFVDGDPGEETRIAGRARINYDASDIGDGIGRRFTKNAGSWREVFP